MGCGKLQFNYYEEKELAEAGSFFVGKCSEIFDLICRNMSHMI